MKKSFCFQENYENIVLSSDDRFSKKLKKNRLNFISHLYLYNYVLLELCKLPFLTIYFSARFFLLNYIYTCFPTVSLAMRSVIVFIFFGRNRIKELRD